MATRVRERPALVSIPAGAKRLGIHRETLRQAVRRGEVPGVTLNGRYYLATSTLDALLRPASPRNDNAGGAEAAGVA